MRYDAVVVGSGPNGLAAAITLARAGLGVLLCEGAATVGGGTRSAELTLPGFVHDVCSSVQALAVASPALAGLDLEALGVVWAQPEVPLAHPLDHGTAAILDRSVERTAASLGRDGARYRRLVGPLVPRLDDLVRELLGPLRPPRHPLLAARFGARALIPAALLASALFRTEAAKGLWAGLAVHTAVPLERAATSAIALVLALAGHAVGWPFVRGGSQRLADALAARFRALGGTIETGRLVRSVKELPPARIWLFDLTPAQLLALDGLRLPGAYRRRLARYRYGPGVFKVDWALAGPIPWTNPDCRRAGTVHVGGTLAEIAAAERAPGERRLAEAPFVLLTQPTVCDPTRAPAGKHTAWGYCHVPTGSEADMTERIERQVERFAPGFRDCILARHGAGPAELSRVEPNAIGGDILGGANTLGQLLARPVLAFDPYLVSRKPGVFLCSASTPPGAGVHGLCGYHAARSALRRLGVSPPGP